MMMKDTMDVPKNKSSRHMSHMSGELAGELSYSSMLMNQNGTLLRKDEIQEMREKQGYCPTCKGTPVKLFEVRKNKIESFVEV